MGRVFLFVGLAAAVILILVPAAALEACPPSLCSGQGEGACPVSQGLVSKPSLPGVRENVYFRNAAPYPAELQRVDSEGNEWPHGILAPGMRRALSTLHGDVWRARAVTEGPANGRLLLEHRIGAVAIRECDCPQPQFVDCSKPVSKADPTFTYDPIVFENHATEPVDLFYWNGTCEELISWDEIGGVQPSQSKPLLSFQGHSFRLRSAASRRLLMTHTLNDVVIRGCSDEQKLARVSPDGLSELRAEVAFFEVEEARLRQSLLAELTRLATALSTSNATATVAPWLSSFAALDTRAQEGVPQLVTPSGSVMAAGGLLQLGK